jgi:hypothetical protein
MQLVATSDGKRRLGGEVSDEAIETLKKAPGPEAIWEHMEDLNAEVTETYGKEETSVSTNDPDVSNTIVKTVPKMLKSKAIIKKELTVGKGEETSDAMEALDKELDSIGKEDGKEPDVEQEAFVTKSKVMEALGKIQGAPTEAQISAWKNKYGTDAVHVTVFSPTEIYIYTHLTRGMWTKVQDKMKQVQESKSNVTEEELQQKVIQHCILWPVLTVEWAYNSRAGVLPSLFQAIYSQSYFLNVQQISFLTTEL